MSLQFAHTSEYRRKIPEQQYFPPQSHSSAPVIHLQGGNRVFQQMANVSFLRRRWRITGRLVIGHLDPPWSARCDLVHPQIVGASTGRQRLGSGPGRRTCQPLGVQPGPASERCDRRASVPGPRRCRAQPRHVWRHLCGCGSPRDCRPAARLANGCDAGRARTRPAVANRASEMAAEAGRRLRRCTSGGNDHPCRHGSGGGAQPHAFRGAIPGSDRDPPPRVSIAVPDRAGEANARRNRDAYRRDRAHGRLPDAGSFHHGLQALHRGNAEPLAFRQSRSGQPP